MLKFQIELRIWGSKRYSETLLIERKMFSSNTKYFIKPCVKEVLDWLVKVMTKFNKEGGLTNDNIR